MKIKYQISDIKITNRILKKSGKFLILHFIFAFLFLIFNFSSAHAWKVPLEVSTTSDTGKKVYNKLVVGIEQGATDGFDNLWDTPSLVSDPNQDSQVLLKAYLNNENEVRDDMKRLWKDIRGTAPNGTTTSWDITIDSVPAGKSVVINWDIPEGIVGKGERLMLKDNDKVDADNKPVQMDMTQVSSYTFEAGETGARSLSLSLSRSKSHHSKSSSGLGCGTIKSYHNDFRDGNGKIASIILLFLPVILVRLKRLTRVRLSI
ncbi:MAG: hypothetical protein HZA08_04460 [Nitrospirae bacterium]|nr:hypothetical protein [Nitrospirota bacterium]